MIERLLKLFERENGGKKAKRHFFRSGGSDVYILLERPLTSWSERMREGEREGGREGGRERGKEGEGHKVAR